MLGTIWITGLSAAGKTTLSRNLWEDLKSKGYFNVDLMDGEDIRKRLKVKRGYSREDRIAVVKDIAELAKQANQAGKIAIVATISHVREARDEARKTLSPFMEVYLKCSPEVCADRDYKGHYAKAIAGQLDHFVGITEPYEESDNPELIIDTASQSVDQCRHLLLKGALSFLNNQ